MQEKKDAYNQFYSEVLDATASFFDALNSMVLDSRVKKLEADKAEIDGMRLTDSERAEEMGPMMAWDMDQRNLHTYSPFNRMESPYNPQGHINPRTGSIVSNRMTTLLGRMHPPTNPMQSKTLGFKDIESGSVQPQHISTGDAPSFMLQQGLYNVPSIEGTMSPEEEEMTQQAEELVHRLLTMEEEIDHAQKVEMKNEPVISQQLWVVCKKISVPWNKD